MTPLAQQRLAVVIGCIVTALTIAHQFGLVVSPTGIRWLGAGVALCTYLQMALPRAWGDPSVPAPRPLAETVEPPPK